MSRRETRDRRRSRTDRTNRAERAERRGEPFRVDVSDRGDEFVVTAELPGLGKQDIDVSVRKTRVRIVADFGDDEGEYLRRERTRGERSRVVHLPERVNERRAAASYDDGVLRVTLPKREPRRRIDIG